MHATKAQRNKIGILITNLGTPDAPTKIALKRYLKEFLSDPRVVEMNRALWWLILNGIILNIRPARSAKAYQEVWSDGGSPLLVHSKNQHTALSKHFQHTHPDTVVVELAMRYGNPSIEKGLQSLREQGCGKILVLPLYPQYAAATTASTFDAVFDTLKTWRWVPEVRTVNSYHDHITYIEALRISVENHWRKHGKPQRLLISFHGIPQRYFDQGDPYPCLCRKSARLLAEALNLADDAWDVSFQSRFGREEWVKPYTDATLKAWGAAGIRRVDVICPGFSADCLETLEEIAVENRGYFMEAGGEMLTYIPALNAEPAHIDALASICQRHIEGW
ncbi:MAG: ferrochelatase [Zetaproteobacteria bacterium]|nr:ferrochelatase [Zetaproteobacteria bacterium]